MQLAALLDPALRRRGGPRTLRRRSGGRCGSRGRSSGAGRKPRDPRGLSEPRRPSAASCRAWRRPRRVLFGKAPHGLDAAEARGAGRAAPRAERRAPTAVARRASALASQRGGALAAEAIARGGGARARAPAGARAARRARARTRRARLLEAARGRAAVDRVRTTLDAALQRVAAETPAPATSWPCATERVQRRRRARRRQRQRRRARLRRQQRRPLAARRHVDGVRARRQAGSTLKPFLYGLALDRRLLTPASLLEDAPLEIAAGRRALPPARTTTSGSAGW